MDNRSITVCDKCFRACCWHGKFMCDDAYGAGTTTKTVQELVAGNYGEHSDYWTAEEMAETYGEGSAEHMAAVAAGAIREKRASAEWEG